MEPTEQLATILPVMCALVDEIRPDQLDNSTPCRNFTVGGVLDHMLAGGTAFAPLFRGEEAKGAPVPPADGQVPAAAFRRTMDELLLAMKSPGALDRIVAAPIGDVPGDVFGRFVAFDGLIHSWDLAVGSGQTVTIPEDVVAAVDMFARQALAPEMRDGDTFAEATEAPEGASLLEQLVAFSGRTI